MVLNDENGERNIIPLEEQQQQHEETTRQSFSIENHKSEESSTLTNSSDHEEQQEMMINENNNNVSNVVKSKNKNDIQNLEGRDDKQILQNNSNNNNNINNNSIRSLMRRASSFILTAADSNSDDDRNNSSIRNGNNFEERFPEPFYCPITKKILVDPVVTPDGETFERSAIEERDKNKEIINYNENPTEEGEKGINEKKVVYYPNRALKKVINEELEMSGSSMRAGIKRLQYSLRKSFSQILEKSVIPSNEYRPLPDAYYCPITFNIIHEPVIDPEGNTFERVAIENWIHVNGSSPLTRTSCSIDDLYPNLAIEDLLDLEKNRGDSSMHSSIRRWTTEDPPEPIDLEALRGGAAGRNHVGNNGGTITTTGGRRTQRTRYPTTEEELELERARRRQVTCSNVTFCFSLILMLLAVTYGGLFIFLFVAGAVFAFSTWCAQSSEGE